MNLWFERLIFILSDFLPWIIINAGVVYACAGKPKLLKKASSKIGHGKNMKIQYMAVYIALLIVFILNALCLPLNIILVILNMIPGISM